MPTKRSNAPQDLGFDRSALADIDGSQEREDPGFLTRMRRQIPSRPLTVDEHCRLLHQDCVEFAGRTIKPKITRPSAQGRDL